MVIIHILDYLAFVIAGLSVFYLFIFALWSLWGDEGKYPYSKNAKRIAVIIPAYKEDRIIERTVQSVLAQNYPIERYTLVLISDQMGEEVNDRLRQLPITLLIPQFEKSSKANALNFAMNYLREEAKTSGFPYDMVTILDSDNLVDPEYLQDLSNAYNAGIMAMQAHRVAKNLNNSTAVLDAVSEEINNSIFRKGHVSLGFSSALIGSGMAFDYKWFEENVKNISTAGEDKELEIMLLEQRVCIAYLDATLVYDEKVSESKVFYNQRRRWLAAQFGALSLAMKKFPTALMEANWEYCDKLFQWTMLPRVVLAGLIGMMSVVLPFIDWEMAIKWWALLLILLFTFAFAIPDYLVDDKLKKALGRIPLLGCMMFLNFFRLKGVNKNFIHTEKSVS